MHTQKFDKILNKSCKGLIQFYQYFIGPVLRPQCRYYPTCSHFALEALEKKSTVVALGLILRRVGSCHPFGGRGYDPVP